MTNKIVAWIWLVLSVLMVFYCLVNPQMESWLFVLVYYLGVVYINIKYIETLKK